MTTPPDPTLVDRICARIEHEMRCGVNRWGGGDSCNCSRIELVAAVRAAFAAQARLGEVEADRVNADRGSNSNDRNPNEV